YQAAAGMYQSFTRAAERGRQAIELAERHGWADEPAAGLAYVILGAMLAWQMRPGEAGPWVQRAERVLRAETEPAAVLGMHRARGAAARPRRPARGDGRGRAGPGRLRTGSLAGLAG